MINKIDTSIETVTKISDDLMMTARVGTDNVRHAQLMDDASNVINALQARAEDAEAKLTKAVAALKFYADTETYEQNSEPPYQNGFFAIEIDEGKAARAVLDELEKPE